MSNELRITLRHFVMKRMASQKFIATGSMQSYKVQLAFFMSPWSMEQIYIENIRDITGNKMKLLQ